MSHPAKPDTLPELVPTEAVPGHSALRAIRETRGYSLEHLSLTCGLAIDEIADIENGKNADPAKLRRIASALRLPENGLIGATAPTQATERRSVA